MLSVTSMKRSINPCIKLSDVRDRQAAEQRPYVKGKENLSVTINISGKRFETYVSTLQRFPLSLLGNPTKRTHFYNGDKDEYFFDRHRKAFSGILYYYQSNGILERPEGVSESLFTQEVMFFELGDIALDRDELGGDDQIKEVLPSNPYLQKIWEIFELPNSSIVARILALISVFTILISIITFCLETLPSLNPEREEGKHMRTTWTVLNTICSVWFTLEYLLRFSASPKKLIFVRTPLNVIDLISVMPFYLTLILGAHNGGHTLTVLRVIRVVRVVRIFKLTRHSRGLHILASTITASFQELLMLGLFLAIGVILFASAVYFAESQHSGTDFQSIPHSFWWAVVTMTTVGYGDLAPSTLIGKLIGTLCAISGVLVIALPVPVIVSNFEYFYKEEQSRRARESEIRKQEHLQIKLKPLHQCMKMMAETSVIIGGPTEKVAPLSFRERLKRGFSLNFQGDTAAEKCDKKLIDSTNLSNNNSEVPAKNTAQQPLLQEMTSKEESKI